MAFQQHKRDVLSKLQKDIPEAIVLNALSRLAYGPEIAAKDEFTGTYLPLASLIHQRLGAARAAGAPLLIGLAGGVAVGKSTVAQILQQALASWPEHSQIALVNSDGFLFPNAELERRGLMDRKGFPESFDWNGMVNFLMRLKQGETGVVAPIYSHVTYDVLPDQGQVIQNPGIVILEGVNALQPPIMDATSNRPFPSDIFNYKIYVHAQEALIRQWFAARFLALIEASANDPQSFYSRFAPLTLEQRQAVVDFVWTTINGKNLVDHILPSQANADLVIHKGEGHRITHFETRHSV